MYIIDIDFIWLILLFYSKNELLINCGEITLLMVVNSFVLASSALDFYFFFWQP